MVPELEGYFESSISPLDMGPAVCQVKADRGSFVSKKLSGLACFVVLAS